METCLSRLQGWAADCLHKLGRLVVGPGAIMATCASNDKGCVAELSYIVNDKRSAPSLARICSGAVLLSWWPALGWQN